MNYSGFIDPGDKEGQKGQRNSCESHLMTPHWHKKNVVAEQGV